MSDDFSTFINKGIDNLKNAGKEVEKHLHLMPDHHEQHKQNLNNAEHARSSSQHLEKKGVLPELSLDTKGSNKASKSWQEEVAAEKRKADLQHEANLKAQKTTGAPRNAGDNFSGIEDKFVSSNRERAEQHEQSRVQQKQASSADSHADRASQNQKPAAQHETSKTPAESKVHHEKTASTQAPKEPNLETRNAPKASERPSVPQERVSAPHHNLSGKDYLAELQKEMSKIMPPAKGQDSKIGYYTSNKAPENHGQGKPSTTSHDGGRRPDAPHEPGKEIAKPVERPTVTTESHVGSTTTKGGNSHFESPNATKLDWSTVRTGAGKVLHGGLGVLGIAGGADEIKQGVTQIREGHKVEGALNVGAGASDMYSGGVSLAFTIGKENVGRVAAKAGGVGAVLSGVSETAQGFRTNNDIQKVEGGIKTTLGVGMLVRASSPYAAAALTGWSGGRLIGEHAGWGGENIDTKVTRALDQHMNDQVDTQYERNSQMNLNLYDKQQGIIGKNVEELKAQGVTRTDSNEAITGLYEKMEQARKNGEDISSYQEQLKQVRANRTELSK
jgi:hypothetical protein